jgi:hypothetical protein
MKNVIIIFLFSIVALYPQTKFNTVLMKKYQSLQNNRNILSLGDQNGDGFDDFMAFDCFAGTLSVYFGGNPIDTIPKYVFGKRYTYGIANFTSADVNHDGKVDIIISYYSFDTDSARVEIYFGGAQLDTIPDVHLPNPPGSSNFWGQHMYPINDFTGDGCEDLVIYDVYSPNYEGSSNGCYYFYGTCPVLDTVPKMIFSGDTTLTKLLVQFSIGDINGDGKEDIWYSTTKLNGGYNSRTGNLVLGNSAWDPSPVQTFNQSEHLFDVERMEFIGDVNGDGKADIIVPSFTTDPNNTYYMKSSIFYGNYPMDTIPHVILNSQNNDYSFCRPVGDVNKDGYNDFMSVEGMVPVAKLWLGGKDMNTHNLPAVQWGNDYDYYFGGTVAAVGDVNGDGVADFAIGTGQPNDQCQNGYFYVISGDTSVVVGVKDTQSTKSELDYRLSEPYPNPFNPSTTINYTLGKDSNVKLAIYNTVGQEIQMLVQEEEKAGVHKYEYSGVNLPSGVYFIELTASEGGTAIFRQSKKLALVK